MLPNFLPVAAFVGAAMAACPLSVTVSGTTNQIASVAVTNTGTEAITVFKGNTVFSEHATLDLLVTDADGKALPFEGIYVNYKKTGLAASNFQTIQPGETITADVNAASTYKLAGVETAQVQAIQGFKYVTGETAPTALSGMAICSDVTSEVVAITPDQSTVADDHISKRHNTLSKSRINKRTITYSSCTTAQTTSLKTSVSDAISMSTKASTAAASSLYYYTTWFKSTSVLSTVRGIYNKVAGVQTTSPKISCVDIYSDCTDGSALLYTVPSDNVIVPCPNNGYWDFPELAPTCTNFDYDKAGSILHEMTHLYGTDDWAYGSSAARALSATKASQNADTYEMYAGSVRLGGCAA